MKILLVEDDDVFVKVLARTLKIHHYTIDIVKDGETGWSYGSTFEYDLIILDVVLPHLDGISLCKRFRAEGYVTPILLLTSQDINTAKVQGLDAGADDYVVKPFDPAELLARIRALLRRGSTNPFPLLTCGDLMLNPSTCEVSYQGQQVALTRKEYELLELMMRNSQHVFSTDELLEHLWSSEEFPSEATVRSHIRRLRQKLATTGAPPDFIATLHGQGYYLKASEKESSQILAAVLAPNTERTAPIDPQIYLRSAGSSISATQQQYIDFLNATWTKTKSDSLSQIAVLLQTVNDLLTNRLTPEAQMQAKHVAHKLAGTLGIFGLDQAVHLSRQLEDWLGSQETVGLDQAPLMQTLVLELEQEVDQTTQIQLAQPPQAFTPTLLLVSTDAHFNQSMELIATMRSIQFKVLTTLDLNPTLDAIAKALPGGEYLPCVILLRFPAKSLIGDADRSSSEVRQLLQILQACIHRYPNFPIVVMADRADLGGRLEIIRRGAKLFLDRSTPTEQVISAAVDQLQHFAIQ